MARPGRRGEELEVRDGFSWRGGAPQASLVLGWRGTVGCGRERQDWRGSTRVATPLGHGLAGMATRRQVSNGASR